MLQRKSIFTFFSLCFYSTLFTPSKWGGKLAKLICSSEVCLLVGFLFFRCGILIYHVTWLKEFIDSRHCENYATEELSTFFFLVKKNFCLLYYIQKETWHLEQRERSVEKNCLGRWNCWRFHQSQSRRDSKKSSRNGRKISVTSPSVLFAGHRCDVQRLLWILNEIHQSTWHVVRPRYSIITFTVFTKAEKNRVDCHLVNREKTMANKKRENSTNTDRYWRVMKARFVLQ